MVAEVIINSIAKSLDREFHYIIPTNLENAIKIGSKVLVPFANMKKLEEGFVIGIIEESSYAKKEIVKVEDVGLTEGNIILANLMRRKYFCNISECIKLMLPPGSLKKNVDTRSKEKVGNFVYLKLSEGEIKELIESGDIKGVKQVKALEFLLDNDGMYLPDLEAITETSASSIKSLVSKGYLEIVEKKIERNPFVNKKVKRDKKLELTNEQEIAYVAIEENINNDEFQEFLIYGVTGSR